MTTFEEIMSDFNPPFQNQTNGEKSNQRISVTLWLSPEDKRRYDRLQIRSGRLFGKKARKMLLALMDLAELRLGSETV